MEFVRQILMKLKTSSNEGLLMKVFSHSLMWLSKHCSGHYVTTQACTLISWGCVHLRWCGALENYTLCKTRLTFLHYLGLLGAIPNRYKELLAQTISKPKTPKLTMLIQCKQKVTKLVYDNMIEETDVFPTKAYQKHKSELDTELSKEDFLNFFLNTLSSTASTKLRDIQFRILHHTLVTNETLLKWGVLNDNRCTFCHVEIESIAHLLIRCRYATNVWKHIENSLQNAGVTIVLTEVEKLLGIATNENNNMKAINLINMVIKQYIYACRCLKKYPSGLVALEKIKEIRNIEMSIAIKNDSLEKHNNKWNMLDFM